MKTLLPKIFQIISSVSFVVAVVSVASWTLWLTHQPECPEEIVR